MIVISEPVPASAHLNWPLFLLTGGFIVSFCFRALLDLDVISVAMWNQDRSSVGVRAFCGLAVGAMPLILIATGPGGVGVTGAAAVTVGCSADDAGEGQGVAPGVSPWPAGS